MTKPRLIVTGFDPHPERGSEPGKSFAWTKALSEFFEIHFISGPEAAEVCQKSGRGQDWFFYSLPVPLLPPSIFGFYKHYHLWCQLLIPKCREVINKIQPVGLYHSMMGSFRLFPDYSRLPVPYALCPLGGGEFAPMHLLLDAALPKLELVKESLRPAINHACLLNPQVRRVLRHSRIALATTTETESLLRWAGAKNTAVVFPDALDLSRSPADPLSTRRQQQNELRENFRCVWSGRFLWWKGGQMALNFLHRLRQSGCNATLDIYSDGPGINRLKTMAVELGLAEYARFRGLVPRSDLLKAYLNSHLFVYPTMHDSSSSAIPEAYSTGLPTFTLALGGTLVATDPRAGCNQVPGSIPEWYDRGLGMVQRWMADPALWLAACEAACQKSASFSLAAVTAAARQHIVPCFDHGA